MIKPEQIPDEVVEAAARILCHGRHPCWSIVAEVMDTDHDGQATEFRIRARETIAAALAAWPGAEVVSEVFTAGGDFYSPHLILSLPEAPQERGVSTENSDE